jgi:ribonuclease E
MPKVTMLFGESPIQMHVNSEVVTFDAAGVAEVSSEAAEVFRGIPHQYEVSELTVEEEVERMKAKAKAEAQAKANEEAAAKADEEAAAAEAARLANLTEEDIDDEEALALEAANAPGAVAVPAPAADVVVPAPAADVVVPAPAADVVVPAPATPAPRKRTAPKAN